MQAEAGCTLPAAVHHMQLYIVCLLYVTIMQLCITCSCTSCVCSCTSQLCSCTSHAAVHRVSAVTADTRVTAVTVVHGPASLTTRTGHHIGTEGTPGAIHWHVVYSDRLLHTTRLAPLVPPVAQMAPHFVANARHIFPRAEYVLFNGAPGVTAWSR
jgi:hypothetical protein